MKRARFVTLVLIAFLATPSVRAQVKIEMSQITCRQFLAFSVADPRDIAIWLSGYYHGKKNDTVLETQELKDNFEKLKSACYTNYDSLLWQLFSWRESQLWPWLRCLPRSRRRGRAQGRVQTPI
jgi:acid stress chaperone HdeB